MKKNFKRRDFLKKAKIGGAAKVEAPTAAAPATPAFFRNSRLFKFFFICPPEII